MNNNFFKMKRPKTSHERNCLSQNSFVNSNIINSIYLNTSGSIKKNIFLVNSKIYKSYRKRNGNFSLSPNTKNYLTKKDLYYLNFLIFIYKIKKGNLYFFCSFKKNNVELINIFLIYFIYLMVLLQHLYFLFDF